MVTEIEIQVSRDYSVFKMILGNRGIYEPKISRLISDFSSGLNLFPYCPIIVCRENKHLKIIDGQHRYVACRRLGQPVYYIEADDIELKDIARMNSNTDKWKNADFIKCYSQLGKTDYTVLSEWMGKHKVSLSVSVSLLQHNKVSGGGSVIANFKEGNFKVNHLDQATEFIEVVDRLFSRYRFYRDRELLKAVHMIHSHNTWGVDRMKERMDIHKDYIDRQSAASTYIFLLEHVYHLGLKKSDPHIKLVPDAED